jgi:hypothetical protein
LDLSGVLLGKTTSQIRNETVLHGISDTLALRAGDWKFIPANPKAKAGGMGQGADAADSRFAANRNAQPMLFNLATDPNEKTNVFETFPDKAAEMQQRLAVIKK